MENATANENAPASRTALLTVFLVVFIDLLGFGLIIPLLGLQGEKRYLMTIWPDPADAPLRGVILGLLLSSYSFMQFLFAPLWGRASDRVGRRPILLVGLFGSVFFYAMLGVALDLPPEWAVPALWLMFAARIGQGMAGATIPTAQAAIADSTTPEKRKVGMAMIGAAFGIGFTFGPIIGAVCLTVFPDHPGSIGYAAAGLSAIALLIGLLRLPETRRPGSTSIPRRWFSLRETREVLLMPSVGVLILLFFLVTFGFASFEPTLAFINEEILGLARNQNYLIFSYVGFVLLLTQGVLYRRLAKRFTEERFMTLGIYLMGCGLAVLGLMVFLAFQRAEAANSPPGTTPLLLAGVLVSITVSVIGFAFLTPSAQSLISRRTDADRQGEVLGVNQSASALARILGPFTGMVLYKAHPSHLLPYAFGSILILAMLPVLGRIRSG